jgi:hypothetical protein
MMFADVLVVRGWQAPAPGGAETARPDGFGLAGGAQRVTGSRTGTLTSMFQERVRRSSPDSR